MSAATTSSIPLEELTATVDKTLIERRRLLGIDRRIAGVLMVMSVMCIGVLRNPWLVIGVPILYGIVWWVMRKDPDLIDVYQQYKGQGDHYEPRPHGEQRYNQRPQGFARGYPCF
ncbi:VirB3 family type IV secretion system protein [Achromobacter aloeverae]